jgi:H+/Cl- antiporter ClcA
MTRSHHSVLVALSALVLITSGALSAAAQSTVALLPENAHTRSYGGGWQCDQGFRPADGACVEAVVPENAYATTRATASAGSAIAGLLRSTARHASELPYRRMPTSFHPGSCGHASGGSTGLATSVRRSLSRPTDT